MFTGRLLSTPVVPMPGISMAGRLHRTDGPALTYAVGTCFWYLQGRELSEEEFEAMTLANKMM